MKKYLKDESLESLKTIGFFLLVAVYFGIFGLEWGMILFIYLITFFFAVPSIWKQSSQKGDKVSLILFVLWWMLPFIILLFLK